MDTKDDSFKKFGYDNIRITFCIGGLILVVLLLVFGSTIKSSDDNENTVSESENSISTDYVPEISENSILDDMVVSNNTISGIDMSQF